MIREQQPDIVNIPTATKLHAPLAGAVLKLGCHVDVEKPLTLSLTEVDRLLAAQRASGKQLVPHHQAAVHPPASKLRDLVKQGFIGEVEARRGKRPSSQPGTYTARNSRPLAACTVETRARAAGVPGPVSFSSVESTASSRKRCELV